jgi:hypothetical protein
MDGRAFPCWANPQRYPQFFLKGKQDVLYVSCTSQCARDFPSVCLRAINVALLARYATRLYQVREPCGAVVQESDCDGHNDINDTNGERRRRFIHLPSAAQRTKLPTENAS